MPGLWLTTEQAVRLWALERGQCEQLLLALVEQRFLVVRGDGKFGRPVGEYPGLRSHAKAPLDA